MTTDQIIKELQIETADDAFRAEILKNITATADLKFARVVDEVMDDAEREEFAAFSEGKEPQEIAEWINAKYEGISEIYTGILEAVVSDLKEKNARV